MLSPSHHDRLARKCATAFTRAVESLPRLLEEADADKAAAIVADLMKAYLCAPSPEVDPGAALAEVLRITAEVESRKESPDSFYAAGEESNADCSVPNLPTFEPSDLLTPTPEAEIPAEPDPAEEEPAEPYCIIRAIPSRTRLNDW